MTGVQTCALPIYDERPTTCRVYRCAWLSEPDAFPEWMRPDLIGVIVTRVVVPTRRDLLHYRVTEASRSLDEATRSWLSGWAHATSSNVVYDAADGPRVEGSREFVAAATGRGQP